MKMVVAVLCTVATLTSRPVDSPVQAGKTWNSSEGKWE